MSDNLSTVAYTQLRAEIIAGVIRPGSKILTRPICARFGIGLSPMREALSRLSSEGLVMQSDRRGFTAAPLDLVDLADLTIARSALNAAALREAIAHGDDAWEEAIVLAHHRLTRAAPGAPEWEMRHRAFHAALLAACPSARLVQYCAQVFDAADRYRLASRAGGAAARDVAGEHAAILRAVLAREADAAVALLDAHVERTAALVRAALALP